MNLSSRLLQIKGRHFYSTFIGVFLNFLRATAYAECFARLIHRLGVRPSVRPSVCHTRDLYQNGAR